MAHNISKYGPWALVTGASSGIGSGFARTAARAGLNVVLVGRREPALGKLAAELDVETRIVVQDLAAPNAAADVFASVADLDIGLLVSNAGAAKMGGFLQNRVEDLRAMVGVNVVAHMELSHLFATSLRTRGRAGGIVLVGSTAGLQPVALGANYSAAKAYVHNLGESLSAELRPLGVDVSVVIPGPTDTPALNERTDIDLSKMPMPTMSVQAVVDEALSALVRQQPSRVAGRLNRWMSRLTPKPLSSWMFGTLMRKNTPARLLPEAPLVSLKAAPDMQALG